jgi:lamin B
LQTDAGSEGDVEVEEHDIGGRFIRLHNKGDDEIALGGWVLKSQTMNREVSYKFHARQAIKPGKTLTVSDANGS